MGAEVEAEIPGRSNSREPNPVNLNFSPESQDNDNANPLELLEKFSDITHKKYLVSRT